MTENTHYHCRQTNRMKSLLPTFSWNDQSLYSLVKDTFLWIDVVLPLIRDSLEKRSIADTCGELLPSILRNAVCRSPWNHLKSGGFNRFIPFQPSQAVQQNAALNAIGHHLLPSSPQSLSTLQTVVRFFPLHSYSPALLHQSLQASSSLSRRRSDSCLPNRA